MNDYIINKVLNDIKDLAENIIVNNCEGHGVCKE